MFRGAEKIGIREDLAGPRELVTQLRSISRQVVETGPRSTDRSGQCP